MEFNIFLIKYVYVIDSKHIFTSIYRKIMQNHQILNTHTRMGIMMVINTVFDNKIKASSKQTSELATTIHHF